MNLDCIIHKSHRNNNTYHQNNTKQNLETKLLFLQPILPGGAADHLSNQKFIQTVSQVTKSLVDISKCRQYRAEIRVRTSKLKFLCF